jgi:hypothetical protein
MEGICCKILHLNLSGMTDKYCGNLHSEYSALERGHGLPNVYSQLSHDIKKKNKDRK